MPRTAKTLVVFRLGGELCALPVSAVAEVLHMAEPARPPGLPRMLEEFLDIGGTATAILRLDRLFGLPEAPLDLYTPMLVLRDARPPLALLVEKVEAVMSVADIVPVAEDRTFNGCVIGEARTPVGNAHLLATERILLEHERGRVEEFEALLRQREKAAQGGKAAP